MQVPISHWHVSIVTHAFSWQDNSGSGLENMTCTERLSDSDPLQATIGGVRVLSTLSSDYFKTRDRSINYLKCGWQPGWEEGQQDLSRLDLCVPGAFALRVEHPGEIHYGVIPECKIRSHETGAVISILACSKVGSSVLRLLQTESALLPTKRHVLTHCYRSQYRLHRSFSA